MSHLCSSSYCFRRGILSILLSETQDVMEEKYGFAVICFVSSLLDILDFEADGTMGEITAGKQPDLEKHDLKVQCNENYVNIDPANTKCVAAYELYEKQPKIWRLACQTTVGIPGPTGLVCCHQQLPEWKEHEWEYKKVSPSEMS
ncbi:hypothetical protein Patl1_28191 [Pistacia atlantica]|uniref:Uncharacterized protein n=1 Tax=Pistacia atlantica TaxID=434234 RepID=A0ACC1BDF3_9ROSI|nr:hypothetical protein Patl1_28191 [Pistacia atlantica]